MTDRIKPAKCLFCYRDINEQSGDYHPECSKKFFGQTSPPELGYSVDEVRNLAEQVVRSQVSVPGVQPKLSLHLERARSVPGAGMQIGIPGAKFTIVGLWGEYIFKPPTEDYPELPEIEDLTMHLAEIEGIKTVPHSLIRFKSGELAYISRRIDRMGKSGKKIHMEDMCQLTERLTEDKYRGSMEQVGKTILKYSSNPGLDAVNYFELVVFSYLTGNADMHLKNFSLINSKLRNGEDVVTLAPAYDLVATKLLIPEDKEEMALPINGKKSNLMTKDFNELASRLSIEKAAIVNVYEGLRKIQKDFEEFIRRSVLSQISQEAYIDLISGRCSKLLGST